MKLWLLVLSYNLRMTSLYSTKVFCLYIPVQKKNGVAFIRNCDMAALLPNWRRKNCGYVFPLFSNVCAVHRSWCTLILFIGRLRSKIITKTCLYNVDPLKPNFYIVKLGFTGVDINFLIFAQNIDCGYSFKPPRRGGSNEYQQSMFLAEIGKYQFVYLKIFSFWRWSFLCIWKGVFS